MTDIVCIIQKLPYSIQNHILSYTYNIQPKILLDDIKSYFSTKCIIHSFYYDTFSWSFHLEEHADLNWLENDIIAYSNMYKATIYVESFYELFYRHFTFHKKPIQHMDLFMDRLLEKSPATTINIMWGLYKVCERIKFINIMYNTDH